MVIAVESYGLELEPIDSHCGSNEPTPKRRPWHICLCIFIINKLIEMKLGVVAGPVVLALGR